MCYCHTQIYVHIFAVLKAKYVSNGTINKGYVFPDEDDDLTNYTGRNAQLSMSSNLLQELCK